jgi:pilus assembly protein Flp/PilA
LDTTSSPKQRPDEGGEAGKKFSRFTEDSLRSGTLAVGLIWGRRREALMPSFMRRFSKDGSGATAIEYALIAAFIAVAIVTAVAAMGTQLNVLYQSVVGAFP